MKAIWDSMLDTSSGEILIDVQIWYAVLLLVYYRLTHPLTG